LAAIVQLKQSSIIGVGKKVLNTILTPVFYSE